MKNVINKNTIKFLSLINKDNYEECFPHSIVTHCNGNVVMLNVGIFDMYGSFYNWNTICEDGLETMEIFEYDGGVEFVSITNDGFYINGYKDRFFKFSELDDIVVDNRYKIYEIYGDN